MRALHRLVGIAVTGLLACGGETGPGGNQYTLDAGRASSGVVGPDGGTLQATDARGRTYRLVIPPLALAEEVEITVTPVATFPPLGGTVAVLAAAHFAPEGLAFAFPASLTITGLDADAASRPAGFSYRGNGAEPVVVVSGGPAGSLHALVSHFSGVGAVADILQLEPTAPLSGAAAAFNTVAGTAYGVDWPAGNWEAAYQQIVASLRAWYHDIVAPALEAADTDEELTNAVAGWSAWQHALDCGSDTCAVESGNLYLWPAGIGALIQQELASVRQDAHNTAVAAMVRGVDRSIATCRANRDLEAAVRSAYWSSAAILLGGDPPDDPVAQCVTLELYEFDFPAAVTPGVPAELSLVAGLSFADAPSTHEHYLTVQVEASDALPAVGGGNTEVGSGRFTQAYTPDGDASVVLGIRIFLGHPILDEELRIDTLIDRPLGVAVTMTPTAAILDPGAEAQFTASVTGTTNTAVTWTASGGSYSVNGNTLTYEAGSVPGEYAVTATSVLDPSRSATASIRIEPGTIPEGDVTILGPAGELLIRAENTAGQTCSIQYEPALPAPWQSGHKECQLSSVDAEGGWIMALQPASASETSISIDLRFSASGGAGAFALAEGWAAVDFEVHSSLVQYELTATATVDTSGVPSYGLVEITMEQSGGNFFLARIESGTHPVTKTGELPKGRYQMRVFGRAELGSSGTTNRTSASSALAGLTLR